MANRGTCLESLWFPKMRTKSERVHGPSQRVVWRRTAEMGGPRHPDTGYPLRNARCREGPRAWCSRKGPFSQLLAAFV